MRRLFFVLLVMSISSTCLWAQKPMAEVELELYELANEILNHKDLNHKKTQNKRFTKVLLEALQREDSYRYKFDSLKTISILEAEDKTFRIFTWQIENRKDPNSYYGETRHYYFGLVQRKYTHADNQTEMIVIPLIEMQEIPRGVENIVLDNNSWLGGLYYPPKYGKGIQKQTLKYFDPKGLKAGQKVKKRKQEYYVLMGWNGMDHTSNIKFIDVMSFDPNDPHKVIFGANVFYFDRLVPKFRALFKYSEYSPFTLNYSYIKSKGFLNFGKKLAIVYDHMGTPKIQQKELKDIYDMGPDGSYDALVLNYGVYDWKKNVEVLSVLSTRDKELYAANQEKIVRARLAQLKTIAKSIDNDEMVREIEEIEARKNMDKYAIKYLKRKEKIIVKRQNDIQEREKKRLKEAGIEFEKS
ncbi:MAG: hypothetical protein AAFY71_11845 [Bacteroidota bacterium]